MGPETQNQNGLLEGVSCDPSFKHGMNERCLQTPSNSKERFLSSTPRLNANANGMMCAICR